MARKILMMGDHPLADCLRQQFEARGDRVEHRQEMDAEGLCMDDYDELCLLTSMAGCGEPNDRRAVVVLSLLAVGYDVARHGGRKLTCHLLLQSNEMLRMLQTADFCGSIRRQVDVYPFTMDEVWSRSLVLDYEPVTIQSQKTVHLVVFGMGEMAEMVAMNAAQVAHYPNYTRDTRLRTRITLIDEEAEAKSALWVRRYRQLFDNSYYRVVKPHAEKVVSLFHRPDYAERGMKDFVDVEWEFVEASVGSPVVREKLGKWADEQSGQLLSVVFCHSDADRNLAEALLLPQAVHASEVPVYLYMRDDAALCQMKQGQGLGNLHAFGMRDRGYDVRLPLVQMAKTVKYVYDLCWQENDAKWAGWLRFAAEIDKERREALWQDETAVMRMSNICNAMSIATKMRSVGLTENDWEKFYDIPQQDIELLAEVEHNRWSVERLILGWRPCTASEQREVEADICKKDELKKRKIHYDLRPYRDLRPDATGKPAAIYDLCLCSCLPLIAKSFADEKGGEG